MISDEKVEQTEEILTDLVRRISLSPLVTEEETKVVESALWSLMAWVSIGETLKTPPTTEAVESIKDFSAEAHRDASVLKTWLHSEIARKGIIL